jgi:glycosyltransferase involved in cell wall biosynthesis
MKILFSYVLSGRGGDAVQIIDMAEALKNVGHTVEVVGPTRLRPYEFRSQSSYLRSWLRRLPWWCRDFIELGLQVRLLLQTRNIIHQFQPDIIWHRAGIYDFVGVRLAKAAKCPLIVHLDAPFPAERAFRHEGYFHKLHRCCIKRLGRSATIISTVSHTSRTYYTGLGIAPEKIHVIHNGISDKLLNRGKELCLKHPPFSHAPPLVLGFAGSLSRWHRVDLLLTALHQLNVNYPGRFRLQITGQGEEYASLRSLEKQLNLEGQVDWLGPMLHEKAFEQIAQSDIAVLPSTLPTGAPMKLFEYAALARPTIAPDLPNLRDLFSADEICFLPTSTSEELAEAVLRLSEKPDLARRLGQKAQERIHQYTWERITKQLLESLPKAHK